MSMNLTLHDVARVSVATVEFSDFASLRLSAWDAQGNLLGEFSLLTPSGVLVPPVLEGISERRKFIEAAP